MKPVTPSLYVPTVDNGDGGDGVGAERATMKPCPKCNRILPLTAFDWHKKRAVNATRDRSRRV